MSNEKTIELHAKFFNHERVLVKDMDATQLREHRHELQSIAFEARARLSAIDAEERERNAKLSSEQKQWLVPSDGNNPNVTDALNKVKTRKERMSKSEKTANLLKNLGLDNADEIVAAIERKQTGAAVTSSSARTLTFKAVRGADSSVSSVPSVPTVTPLASQVVVSTETVETPKTFDPSNLFKK